MVRRPQGTKKSRENRRGKASFSRSVVPGFFPDTQAYPGWRRTAAVPWACAGVLHCVRVVLLNRHPCSARGKLLCIRYPKRFVCKAKACSAFFQCFTPVFIRINETSCGYSGKQVMFRNNVLHAASSFLTSGSRFNETLYERNGKHVPLLNDTCTRQNALSPPPRRGRAAMGRRPEGLPSGERQNARSVGRACTLLGRAFGFRAAPASPNDTHNSSSGTQV